MGYIIDKTCFQFVPRTFVFPNDLKAWAEYKIENPKSVYITKPKAGSEGNNIVLFENYKEIPQ